MTTAHSCIFITSCCPPCLVPMAAPGEGGGAGEDFRDVLGLAPVDPKTTPKPKS